MLIPPFVLVVFILNAQIKNRQSWNTKAHRYWEIPKSFDLISSNYTNTATASVPTWINLHCGDLSATILYCVNAVWYRRELTKIWGCSPSWIIPLILTDFTSLVCYILALFFIRVNQLYHSRKLDIIGEMFIYWQLELEFIHS